MLLLKHYDRMLFVKEAASLLLNRNPCMAGGAQGGAAGAPGSVCAGRWRVAAAVSPGDVTGCSQLAGAAPPSGRPAGPVGLCVGMELGFLGTFPHISSHQLAEPAVGAC